jgi:PAS domain S-box
MQRQLDMTLRGKAPSSGFELRVRRKDGSLFHALYVSPLIDSSGRQTGWMSSMTDITEPKRAREELAAAHERFTTVLESLDAASPCWPPTKPSCCSPTATTAICSAFARTAIWNWRAAGSIAHRRRPIRSIWWMLRGPARRRVDRKHADAQEVYVQSIQKWFEVRRQYIQWVDGHLAQMQIATDITTRKQARNFASAGREAAVHQPPDDDGRNGLVARARTESAARRDQ